ncbi:MAG: preprotein translocase subunit SecE [Bacteroidetes bacterium]|nr:preprotein translocase subunit SecE [Bacteroidota bacterium]
MNKITAYVKDSFRELSEKVAWPTWVQLQQSTMIVLVATLIITLIILIMDFATGNGLRFIYKQLF